MCVLISLLLSDHCLLCLPPSHVSAPFPTHYTARRDETRKREFLPALRGGSEDGRAPCLALPEPAALRPGGVVDSPAGSSSTKSAAPSPPSNLNAEVQQESAEPLDFLHVVRPPCRAVGQALRAKA